MGRIPEEEINQLIIIFFQYLLRYETEIVIIVIIIQDYNLGKIFPCVAVLMLRSYYALAYRRLHKARAFQGNASRENINERNANNCH